MEKDSQIKDISKEIEQTSPVTKEIAEKEEKISKSIGEIPISQDELEERKRKIIGYLDKKKEWVTYLILTIIVSISFYIRTLNIPKLKDITTGDWTLGPDLDPFLFLRWAKDIVEQGSLPLWDYMRYVPIGYNTAGEMKLLSYLIAWFYNLLSFFSKEVTVTYAAIIFPAVMFVLTAVAFFLFTRKIFYKEDTKVKNILALIATGFFVLMPSLLPRTIAGIPEKESVAFFFMFISFYLFLEAFTSDSFKKGLIFGISSGITTGLMALIWGGSIFIFFTIPPAFLVAFIIGKINIQKNIIYASWIITSFLLMIPFSTRYNIFNLITSASTGSAIMILGLVSLGIIIIKSNKLENLRKRTKLPKEIFVLILSFIFLTILALIVLGPELILNLLKHTLNSLIRPMTTRFGLTVAENKQPYFINDWKNSFGPIVMNIPLYFWLFFMGAIALFYNLVRKLRKKEKIILTMGYLIFLVCLIFSRYSPNSILNGTSGLSILVYIMGVLVFVGVFGHIYYKRYKEKKLEIFKSFEFSYLMYFFILTLGLIGARSGIRLIMVLGAVSPIAVAFLIVKSSQKYLQEKDETIKFFMRIFVMIILISSLFTIWIYYQGDKNNAESFAPGVYQWQWQKAMGWVRENTPDDAVFAHWWDYGYWLQSIGERATILDGGNAIVYWNHLMGRHVLTGPDEMSALEFLYTHNGTHLLIDSTEIGKYTAYSSIGADENYDRFSWISNFFMDEKQTQETNNETIYVYTGMTAIDDDIIWEQEGKEILLPKKKAGIGAIILKIDLNQKITQPNAIFVYNKKQYMIPLRYAYFNEKLYDFEEGLNAGVYIFPLINSINNGQMQINKIGAMFYLSEKTVHSQLAKLYLFGEKSDYFKLVHSEDNLVVESLKNQKGDNFDIIYSNYCPQTSNICGPIKIWEINYPKGIKSNPHYLLTDFLRKEIDMANLEEYN